MFGVNLAGDSFWNEILSNRSSQKACPWTNDEYDKLREELLYHALMLHKAFVVNSNYVATNLRALFMMWDKKFNKEDKQAAYASLFSTLQLVVPVISRTFPL